MRKPFVFALLLSPLCCYRAEAAPAPLPKPEADAEVVFDARTSGRAERIACFLRSRHLAQWARSHPQARQVLPQVDDAQLEAWLKDNLTVTSEGTLIRVRFRGALGPLQSLTMALSRKVQSPDNDRAKMEREIRFLRLALLVEDSRRDDEVEALRGYGEIENEPLKVQSSPRATRRR